MAKTKQGWDTLQEEAKHVKRALKQDGSSRHTLISKPMVCYSTRDLDYVTEVGGYTWRRDTSLPGTMFSEADDLKGSRLSCVYKYRSIILLGYQ